jgi:hypothetical protein
VIKGPNELLVEVPVEDVILVYMDNSVHILPHIETSVTTVYDTVAT